MLFAFGVPGPPRLLCFPPSADGALREPDCAVRPVQRGAADGQRPHDRGRALFLPDVRFLGRTKHRRYVTEIGSGSYRWNVRF